MPAAQPAADADLRFYEYSTAADPRLAPVPFAVLGADAHADGPSRVVTWDLSQRLGCPWPATTPALLAGFLRLRAGETLTTEAAATAQLFAVIRGAGRSAAQTGAVDWETGDLFTMPAGAVVHAASADAALYWVDDRPLLSYLDAVPRPRGAPLRIPAARLRAELARVRAQPGAARRNRLGVILGHADADRTRTLTRTLWALYNLLPAGAVQRPHRHNSVALDLCLAAAPGTYTLIGRDLDAAGNLVDAQRADWTPGAAFVTPPGLWHSHHNESGSDALVLPIQDAGLHTWLRTLDIRFADGSAG